MGMLDNMAKDANREAEKMRKKEELRKQLEKANEQGIRDRERGGMKAM